MSISLLRGGYFREMTDPEDNSILFNATAVEQLPAEVCKTANGTTTCDLPVDVSELAIPVSALTWTASGSPMDRGPTLPWL